MSQEQTLPGPDLTQGISLSELADSGTLVGHCGGEEVLLVRQGSDVFAVGAHCSHYHGPLADGLVVNNTIRCPWHHAAFDLRTGEAVRAPALSPIGCWSVEQRDGKVFVKEKQTPPKPEPLGKPSGKAPDRVVIVGGGAAGFAAAEMLRRRAYQGRIAMVSGEAAPPIDRPNLSKDYLAGTAPEEWVPLRPDGFYAEKGIDLRLSETVTSVDARSREVKLASGEALPYDRLLLATGAEPIRPVLPGFNEPHIHTLRSLADCQAIIERAKSGSRAVVIGASFIGLEVAASLRTRGLEVHVVAPENWPMERILGTQMGEFVKSLHEEHGVVFHLGQTASAIAGRTVKLKSGVALEGDLIVAGVGVRPRIELAEKAGLAIDRGVAVNAYLETSTPGIFAAGDIARWPDPYSGENIRVEHWVVAERQGQTAALNMLGAHETFDAVPFFWSQHYEVPINYVGHTEKWDDLLIDGDIAGKDCIVRYRRGGRTLAVASIYRDVESLKAELAMEKEIADSAALKNAVS
jgi:NADPH-dependent 2,4-dienoyl-CoA reductase/sulfur reductase-like enzyme/nitrite reductase/ring-hydroxylating ferredoxin subunit